MADFVITDERSLKTRQGAVGRGIRWIYRFMDAAHAENLVVPIDQTRQIPGEHTDMLELRVNDCVSIDHWVFIDIIHSTIACKSAAGTLFGGIALAPHTPLLPFFTFACSLLEASASALYFFAMSRNAGPTSCLSIW